MRTRLTANERFGPYTNGKWWEYERGVDFECRPDSHASYACKWAQANGFIATYRVCGPKVYIKFRPRNPK